MKDERKTKKLLISNTSFGGEFLKDNVDILRSLGLGLWRPQAGST
jgi:hypothetical protein